MRLFVFLTVFFLSVCFSGCENKISDIDGEWKRFDTVWKFENSKAYINGSEYEFHTHGGTLFLSKGNNIIKVPYSLKDGTLTVNGSQFNKNSE